MNRFPVYDFNVVARFNMVTHEIVITSISVTWLIRYLLSRDIILSVVGIFPRIKYSNKLKGFSLEHRIYLNQHHTVS